jgi:hypothetical protein
VTQAENSISATRSRNSRATRDRLSPNVCG